MSASNELSNRERNFPPLAGRLLPTSRGEKGEKAFPPSSSLATFEKENFVLVPAAG